MNTKSPFSEKIIHRAAERILLNKENSGEPDRRLFIETLEPRILFSGSPAPAPTPEPSAETAPAQETSTTESPAPASAAPASEIPAEASSEGSAPTVASPPEATEDTASVAPPSTSLTQENVETIVAAATQRWIESGISTDQADALSQVNYVVADLGGNILGSTDGALITIDDDAAGHGWFVDPTPEDNGEFELAENDTSSSLPAGIDLLSILLHEQGHILGLDGATGPSDVMNGVFVEGERRLPADGQADGAVAGSLEGVHYALVASTTILSDDFSAGSVAETFRIYENRIDDGWNKGPFSYSGQPASAWTISGGEASNASSLAATGYPDSKEAEAPLYNFFSGAGTTETHLNLRFAYDVATGDELYVHLWGLVGTSNEDGEFISNIEASANGNVNLNGGTGDTTDLTTYNLTDGAASGFGGTGTAISGMLTGNGTANIVIDIADLGIGGVTTAGDLDYYVVQFAKQEDGTAGTTSIDNFSLVALDNTGREVLWDDGRGADGTANAAAGGGDADQNFTTGTNWRVDNVGPSPLGVPPNDFAPDALDRANIAFDSGTNNDGNVTTIAAMPAAGVGGAVTIGAGENVEIHSARIGSNPGLSYGGNGRLENDGGTITVTNGAGGTGNNFILGADGDRSGVYIQTAGTLEMNRASGSTGHAIIVGNSTGEGFFGLSGGTVNADVTGFRLAETNTSNGSLVIDGGTINVAGGNFETANAGTGVVTMNGGALNVDSNNLIVNQGGASNGTFTLNNGTVDLHNQLRFNGGTGVFNQTGGTLNVGTILDIGNTAGGDGTYTMTGGNLNVGDRSSSDLIIGNLNDASVSAKMEIIDGTVNVARSIRIANTGANSSGELIVGDGTTSPTITLNTGAGNNFETAVTGSGTFTFKSGTITINNSNLITGQNATSVANVTIGGFAAAATLNVDGGDGNRDWNTNTGDGNVTVSSNGTVNVGRSMNLGNNGTQGGLILDIDGGTVNVGTKVAGDVNYRNNGVRDEITLQGGGTFDVNRNFVMNQGTGKLNVTGSTNTFSIGGNYNQNGASTLTFTADAMGISTINVTGAANLGGTLALDLSALSSVTAAGGDIVLIDSATTTGTFATAPTTVTLGDGSTYTLSYNYDAATGLDGTGNDVALVATAETQAGLDGSGNFVIEDTLTATADNLKIELVDGGTSVQVSNATEEIVAKAGATQVDANTVKIDVASITGEIIINAGGENDTLTVELGGGNFTKAITFNGEGQTSTPGDTLVIEDSSAGTFATAVFNYTNENDGSIDIAGNQTISYTGLEPITSMITATNVTINLNSTDATETVDISGDAATTTINSSAGETTTFTTPTGTLTINGGDGAQTFNVTDVYATNTRINAGAGDDTLVLDDAHGTTFTFYGGIGDNVTVSDNDNVTVNDTHTTGLTLIGLENGGNADETAIINNAHSGSLTVSGNAGNDTITVVDTNTIGATTINGDNNNDIINVTDAHTEGGSGSLVLNGGSQNDTISVTTAHGATLLIQGGNDTDTITLTQTETTGVTTIRSNNGNDTVEIFDAMSSQLIVDSNNNSGDIGQGNDTITLHDTHTSGQTVLDSTNGGTGSDDTFIVHNAHSPTLRVQTRGGNDNVTINDTNTTGNTIVITNNSNDTVTITGAGTEMNGTTSLTVDDQDSDSGVTDTLNIGGPVGSGNLDNIKLSVLYNGNTATDILNINDEANTAGRSIVIDGANTSISAGAQEIVNFNGTTEDLNINTGSGADTVTIDGALTIPRNLTINADDIVIDAPTVTTTTGDQTYNGSVELTQDTEINGGNDVTFTGTINSDAGNNHALTVNSPGVSTFAGAVGATDALASLTTDAAGTTEIGVSTSGLEVYLPLDQISGNQTSDSSGNGRDGTLTGDLATGNPVAGISDNAIDFENDTDHVAVTGYKGVTGANDRTMAAWVKFDSTGGNDQAIMSWGSDNSTRKWIFRTQSGNGPIDGNIRIEVNGGYIVGTTDIRDGEWHHVAATFANDGTPNVQDILLYVDGELEAISASLSRAVNTNNNRDVQIGQDHSNRDWTGLIDEALIWSRALSSAEIAALAATPNVSINTTGDQTFNDDVTLNTKTENTGTGNVTYANTVDGERTLTLTNTGTATFTGTVGGTTPLTSITASADTAAVIADGVAITTVGDQTFNGGLDLSVTMTPSPIAQTTSTSTTLGDGVVLADTSTFTAQIIGATTPGTDYDQLVVNGEVDLNDADLVIDMAPTYTPAGGDSIVLISNDGTDAVNGTFAGLAEGNIIAFERDGVANALFRITYVGGDGNDVVLETADTNATTSIHLDGSGNLIIQDVDEDVVGGGTDGNDKDNLTIRLDGTDVVITDPDNVIGSIVPGSVQTSFNEVRISTSLFIGDVIVQTRGEADVINIGSLGDAGGAPGEVIPGGLIVDGGDAFDTVDFLLNTASVLTDDANVDVDAEKVMFTLADLTVGGTGSIDLNATDPTDASGGTMTYNGLWLYGSDLEATGAGTITLAGEGGDTGTYNNGIKLTNGSDVTTADGDIDIDGAGGGNALFGTGVALHHGSSVSAGGNGALTIDGTAGAGSSFNEGVFLSTYTSATVADGDLTITGTGNGTGSQNQGVDLSVATLTATGTGNIAVIGSGSGSGTGTHNTGVTTNATDITTTTGTVTLAGSGGAGTSNNQGVRLAATDVTTTGGSIDVDGTGNGSAVYNTGVQLVGSTLEAGGAGTIDIDGTAGNGTVFNEGVQLSAGSTVKTATGTIGIRGTGMGTITGNRGVTLISSTAESTGGGDITLRGTASAASIGALNDGISLSYSHTTTTGTLTMAGTGGGGSVLNSGVKVVGGSLSGTLDIDGTGGGSAHSNAGVYIMNTDLGSASGTITGTGGAGSGVNFGAFMQGIIGGFSGTVTTDPDDDEEKGGNFFPTILPLALIAAADSRSAASRQDNRKRKTKALENHSLQAIADSALTYLPSSNQNLHSGDTIIFKGAKHAPILIDSAQLNAQVNLAASLAVSTESYRACFLMETDDGGITGLVTPMGKDGKLTGLATPISAQHTETLHHLAAAHGSPDEPKKRSHEIEENLIRDRRSTVSGKSTNLIDERLKTQTRLFGVSEV